VYAFRLFLQICRNLCYYCNVKPLQNALQHAGYSSTQARRLVFRALQGQTPLTMHELVERCRDIDRASVYRTIALFERLGIVQRVQTGWKYRLELSDTFHEHHHHATCLNCRRSFDIPEDTRLEVRLYEMADTMDFQLERHQLELQGYCLDCKNLLAV
jgi:Fe2+ or Zn2+ uptake regulation protein